jgi:hypothetical protein
VGATVFFQDAAGDDIATLQQIFQISGVATDPTAVSCVITDPTGAAVTHTFGGVAPADITKLATGTYQLLVPSTIVGMWSFVWIGTGTASDIQPGTWTVNPAATLNQLYTSVEEVKDRLKITDTQSDLQLTLAVQGAAEAVEGYCGRFFYQRPAETRTFQPYDIWMLPIDDLVSVTALNVDFDGDGVFETAWVKDVDYELIVGPEQFNQAAFGIKRPFTVIRVINVGGGGRFFPFTWPFSRLDRVQIIGTWGWPQVPAGVKQASMQLATELFKLGDAPFGLAGTSEFGVVRIPKVNPYVAKMLNPFINPRRRVGV